jgi:hypothetical protein
MNHEHASDRHYMHHMCVTAVLIRDA